MIERAAALAVPRSAVVVTTGEEHFDAEARSAVAGGVSRLVVVGGDGTVHRVLAPLSGSGTALGIVPAGTGNDLAGALGIHGGPDRTLERALGGTPRRIDLGEVEGRLFAGTAGIGFDGEVARRVRTSPVRRIGSLAYALSALAALGSFVPPRVEVEFDGGRIADRVMFVVLANSPRFGGGMRIAPDASLDDGRFDLVFVRRVGRFDLVRTLPKVDAGRHVDHPAVDIHRTETARITVERPATVWGDGEPILSVREGSIEFRIRPAALSVAV